MDDLRDKVAVVTGSTSGIGKAIAESLAKAGAHIVLNGRRYDRDIENQRATLQKKYGIIANFIQADMTKPNEIVDMIHATVSNMRRIDILVNNAGIQHVAPLDKFPQDKWDEIMAVHLTAPFVATKTAFPYMKEQGWGRILNIASAHAETASPGKAAYVSAKHGMMGLTKVSALEGAEYGITVNAISPGYVLTPLVDKQIRAKSKELGVSFDEAKEQFASTHATRKLTTVEAIGAAALHFCSEFASNTTGTNYVMDGGWTVGRNPTRPADKNSYPTSSTSLKT